MADTPDELEPTCPPDPHLVTQGWERRFIADPVQARAATALYRSLGFEVHTEPLTPTALGPPCSDCQLVACHTFVTIYTRKERPLAGTSGRPRSGTTDGQ
jgi:hypothetical protein